MGKISFSENGWEDDPFWQTQDKKTLKRINQLLQDILSQQFEEVLGDVVYHARERTVRIRKVVDLNPFRATKMREIRFRK